jgi:hypothetical protein
MKNFTSGKTVLCALGLVALLGVTAQAQTYSVRVDVPFQFEAGNRMFPAGAYDFVVDNSIHALKIQSRTDTAIRLVPLTPGSERRSNSQLEMEWSASRRPATCMSSPGSGERERRTAA